jgi:hypothetical protein
MILLASADDRRDELRIDFGGTGRDKEWAQVFCTLLMRGKKLTASDFIKRTELLAFSKSLLEMHAAIGSRRQGALWSVKGEFVLTMTSGMRGEICAEVLVYGRPLLRKPASLHGRIDLDQSHLPALSDQFLALHAASGLDYDYD